MAVRHLLRRVGVWAGAQAGRGAVSYHSTTGLGRPYPVGYLLDQRQRRTYATRTVAADSYLVQVLKSEIEHELREEASKQGSLKGSTGPFELSDKAGTEEVILRRKFGNEQIAVTCIVESQCSDEDTEAEGEANENEEEENQEEDNTAESKPEDMLHLNVTITKDVSMPALEFECTYVRGADEVEIEAVSFLSDDSAVDEKDGVSDAQAYGGPEFSELDEKLQQAFHDLLKARGLSPKIATYVLDYLTVKEHREYMRWLHNVETFFSS